VRGSLTLTNYFPENKKMIRKNENSKIKKKKISQPTSHHHHKPLYYTFIIF
jgi:hypothetical protein